MENTSPTTAVAIATNVETVSQDKSMPSAIKLESVLSEEQVSELQRMGFTRGLALALEANMDIFPLRVWIVDNSRSMSVNDGKMFLFGSSGPDDVRTVPCTRWKEIQETVEYHARIAALLKAPTIFRLLNDPGSEVGPQTFGIADRGDEFIAEDLQVTLGTIQFVEPFGVTPLCKHIYEIRQQILPVASNFQALGQKVSLVIATDGLPTDEVGIGGHLEADNFVTALRSLEGLPVWITIRLSTDEKKVVEFYNDLDAQIELSIEVIDDYTKEAKEVHNKNKWCNYSLALHRCREMGFHHRLFDLIDERLLTFSELYDFCMLMLGKDQFDNIPDPAKDFDTFLSRVKELVKKEQKQWNPIKKGPREIIDFSKVESIYSTKSCVLS